MPLPNKRGIPSFAAAVLALSTLAYPARADEIRLKDGKTLYGSVVAIEDGMYKVKTDFGFVLVEKDKIASIIPSEPDKKEPNSATKKDPAQHPAKPAADSQRQPGPALATSTAANAAAAPTNASAKTVEPTPGAKTDKASSKATSAATKLAPGAASAGNTPSATNALPSANATPSAAGPASAAPAPPTPKEPEVPANREEVTGNLYTNYTHGFRMYKAPSWNLIEEARSALPNAIVAMGTNNESTLLVVGEEKAKDSLDAAAAAVEKRLHDVYENYQRVSQRKETVGGLPAIEYQYRGKAEDHDWSGRLVVIARGKDSKDILTVLAMTYADSDLIQIQENVIARSIASLDFSVH